MKVDRKCNNVGRVLATSHCVLCSFSRLIADKAQIRPYQTVYTIYLNFEKKKKKKKKCMIAEVRRLFTYENRNHSEW